MRKLLVVACAVAVLAAACSSDPVVATVNGSPITLSQVEQLSPVTDGPIPVVEFSENLETVIVQEIVAITAESEFGLLRDEEEVDAEFEALKGEVEAAGADFEAVLAEQGLTDSAVREMAFQRKLHREITTVLVAGVEPLSDENLRIAYEGQLLGLASACVSHILVETEEEAAAVLVRLDNGADFAALATELSIGPSAPGGGELGCTAPGEYVLSFANAVMEAPVGQPFGPVESQFGWHVILVESREVPTLEEARTIIDNPATRGPVLFRDWLLGAVQAADVQIEPQYGMWVTAPSPGVLPPEG